MTGTNTLTIIAEAGVNHNGDLGRARDMVCVAADAGATYVKFQIFDADKLVAKGTTTAAYQQRNTGRTDQAELLRDLELKLDDFARLAEHCQAQGVGFLCTAFDESTIEDLISFGMDCIKVASGELTNTPALAGFAQTGLPIYLSTGMATLQEVGDAIDILRLGGAGDITALQCTSLYPAPFDTLNLLAMKTMADAFDVPVGFSDHSMGSHAAIAAVALGASAIEKHFTLDRTLPGPDHLASLEPDELKDMIAQLRDTHRALGDGIKRPADAEAATANRVRRSWHAIRNLPVGHIIAPQDVALLRPADGLAPNTNIVGVKVHRALKAGQAITLNDLD